MLWDEGTREIQDIYERICSIEKETKQRLILQGLVHDADQRTSFELLDLSELYPELKIVMLFILDHYSIAKRNNVLLMKMYKVFIAGLCEMIKYDYANGYILTFKVITGRETLNLISYYKLLERALESEDIKVNKKGPNRDFEGALIQESGIPKSLTKDILRFFKIYWKYFRERPLGDRQDFLEKLFNNEAIHEQYFIEPKDYEELVGIHQKLKDFPQKVKYTIEKFEKIFRALEAEIHLVPENEEAFLDACNKISQRLGYDILKVLRSKKIKDIYDEFIRTVTFKKFRKILANLPLQEKIKLPGGNFIAVSDYKFEDYYCGIHIIRNIDYRVVYDINYDFSEMLGYRRGEVHYLPEGNVLYRSECSFPIEIGEINENARNIIYKDYDEYIWIGKIPPAMPVYIDDKPVNILEKYKISCQVKRRFNRENKTDELAVVINELLICDKSLANKMIYLSCSASDIFIQQIVNGRGRLSLVSCKFSLNSDENKLIDVRLEGQGLKLYSKQIVLKNKYLFDAQSGEEINMKNRHYQLSREFVYFCSENIDIGEELQVLSISSFLDYKVIRFRTNDTVEYLQIGDDKWYIGTQESTYLSISTVNEIYDENNVIKNIYEAKVLLHCNEHDVEKEKISLLVEHNSKNKRYTLFNIFKGDKLDLETIAVDMISQGTAAGKWILSIWKNQKRLSVVNFTVIPNLIIKQIVPYVLENKDVWIKVMSDMPCFENKQGDLVKEIDMNIGRAELKILDNFVTTIKLERDIYLSALGVNYQITWSPRVWGARIKDYINNVWIEGSQMEITSVPIKDFGIYVCSVFPVNLTITCEGLQREMFITPGFNKVMLHNIIQSFKKVNKIKLANEADSTIIDLIWRHKITATEEKIVGDILKLKYRYSGPIDEIIFFNVYCDDKQIKRVARLVESSDLICAIELNNIFEYHNKYITVQVSSESQPNLQLLTNILVPERVEEKNEEITKREISISDFEKTEKLLNYYKSRNKLDKKILIFQYQISTAGLIEKMLKRGAKSEKN